MNLSDFKVLGDLWNSETLLDFERELNGGDKTTSNAGDLVGNRMFYANDYMVNRGSNYVSTLKVTRPAHLFLSFEPNLSRRLTLHEQKIQSAQTLKMCVHQIMY